MDSGGGQVSETIDANYHKGWLDHGQRTHIKDGSGGGQRQYDEKTHMGFSQCMPIITPGRPNKRQNGRRFKNDREDMFTLTGQDIHGVMIKVNNGE